MNDDIEFTFGEKVTAAVIAIAALGMIIAGAICTFEWIAD